MSDILRRIKRAIMRGNYVLTLKARSELDLCGLEERDAAESILNATKIEKTIKSKRTVRGQPREYLHVIISPNFDGVVLYTKGKLTKLDDVEIYYVLISAKDAE